MAKTSIDLTNFSSRLVRTEEEFAAINIIYPSEIVMITEGGVNDGRVKVTDGLHTWSGLEYEAQSTGDGEGITSINLDTGPAIELRIPLDALWVQINNSGAPAAGEFEANSNTDATAVTSLTFHSTDAGGSDQTALFASMRIGGLITGRQTNNDGTNTSGSPCIYRITAAPTLASSRYTIAVAYVSGAFIGSFPNWYVGYAYNEAKEYVAVAFGGGGTAAPIVTSPGYVLKDDFTGLTFGRSSPGAYTISKVGAFTADKVWGGSGVTPANGYLWAISRGSADLLNLSIIDPTTLGLVELPDDDSAHINFKVYP